MHVVSLRELLSADRTTPVIDVGDRRTPLSVRPAADREDVARIIAKYNLLALPVVDDDGHMLGIVTVDDVIDAIVREQTEDAQKFGGVEALDAPYMEISFGENAPKARRLAYGTLSLGDAHRNGDATLSRRDRAGSGSRAVHSARHELRRQFRLAGDVADHSRARAQGTEARRLVANRASRASDRAHSRRHPRRRSGLSESSCGRICTFSTMGRIIFWSRSPSRSRWLASWGSAHSPDRCSHSCSGGSGSIRPARQLRSLRRWSM